ncbi:hypothetical protein M433DRAFT_63914 [Acidomyces richmondensis BFW]|nr:hypothetical protein M433DRAFT_63914 [Acidomyces richmondensis BFW]
MSKFSTQATTSNAPTNFKGITGNFHGLRVVYQPDAPAPIDIIFVHGLKGHIWKTWSKNHDIGLFWPGLWLPEDVDIGVARIFSFGYNAEYGPGAGRTITNVADFAKDLLQAMKFGQDDEGNEYELGRVPIIFVVHSMGGLIVKKAYLLGQHDKVFREMVQSVAAIVFLATPHRGSSFAGTLNRVLMASLQSPKGFISDLNKSSSTLEEINEGFRHVAEKLWIWSFYETRATKVVTQRIMIVDKDSAVLGYPNEISASLDADHINICKYNSPDDANYISVRNALRSLVAKAKLEGAQRVNEWAKQNVKDVGQLLAVFVNERSDLDIFRSRRAPGTCLWFLEDFHVRDWLDVTSESRILWYSAPPGTGKSFLSAFMVEYLRDQGMELQYFFFRFDDPQKRSLSTCLRQLAYQFAMSNRAFCKRLQSLSQEGIKLDRADPDFIWHKVFEAVMFEIGLSKPLFWVIDALDESENPAALLDLLQRSSKVQKYLRVLILSKKSSTLSLAFERLSSSTSVSSIEHTNKKHAINDISIIIDKEAAYMRGSDAFKRQVKDSLLKRAEGNLLWVRLVLQEILICQTEQEVMEILEDIPDDMTLLYERMEASIFTNPRKANIKLATSLLRWAVCSRRPLKLTELSDALPGFLDLRRTISDLCGYFVNVDEDGTVHLIHQTAREYLTKTSASKISINLKDGHDELCLKAISVLMGENLRSDLTHRLEYVRQKVPFISYASTSWTYHLRHGNLSEEVLKNTVQFLQSLAILTWIHTLALFGRLDVLVETAKDLIAAASMLRRDNDAKSHHFGKLVEIDILERWSVDLMRILAKFGKAMSEMPLSIYKIIPGMCPAKSIIYEQFHQSDSVQVSIPGNNLTVWNDNLVRLFLPEGQKATRITCAGSHLAVVEANGLIYIWNTRDFVSTRTLYHEEPITAMCLNRKGDRLATYGLQTTKHWSIPSGELLCCAKNIPDIKAMAVRYAENDKKILAGMDDNRIRYLNIEYSEPEAGWRLLCDAPSRASWDVERSFFNSPSFMQFNGDETQIGVCYRGCPLTVWSLNENRCIGRSKRSKFFGSNGAWPSGNRFAVDRFTFNPVTGHVLGIYKEGCIFKWHPITDENHEVSSNADEIDASADGKLFITSNTDGNIAVWSFPYMSKIYQLSSSGLVQGLSFSPDTQRFYDIRGRSVNAWEPDALIKFIEREVSGSDSASEEQVSSFINPCGALATPIEAITAVATCLNDKLFCVGNEEGIIHLHDVQTGQKRKIAEFSNSQCVNHLALSVDGTRIVAADLIGDFLLKEISDNGSLDTGFGAIKISTLARPKLDLQNRAIHQILFNNDASLLLVVSNSFAQIWSIHLNKVIARSELKECHTRQWLQHFSRDELIFGFGPYDIKVYRWSDLKELSTICFDEKASQVDYIKPTWIGERLPYSHRAHLETTGIAQVTRAFLTQDGLHILVQVKIRSAQGSGDKRLLIFDRRHLEQTIDSSRSISSFFEAPKHILDCINIPLGILPGCRLVFLDTDLWLCTINLSTLGQKDTVRRRFFVPRDWATTACFELSCLLQNGIFICPRDADVAIVNYCWEDSCM